MDFKTLIRQLSQDSILAESIIDGYSCIFETEYQETHIEPMDIVGSDFNLIRPTQDAVNPKWVNHYYEKIQNGESLPQLDIIEDDNGVKYLQDGHHRLVAYIKNGIMPSFNTLPGSHGTYPSWKDVRYDESLNERQSN